MTATVRRLNHAVLYVRDARRASAFYSEAFGFEVLADYGEGAAVFMRAAGTENHHDLGLFSLGPQAPLPQPGRVGLYHLAWQVDTITELAEMRETLLRLGALVGESDHGVTKSLYGKDPDGNEFEVMWMVPREQWGDMEHEAITRRLDLPAELAKHA
jgi:catechol-2,3-dioxygenase